jgi:shikimate dehydrogenase
MSLVNHPQITGRTRLYAIIGDPIAQVRSPAVYNARFAEAGVDAVMVPIRIPPAVLDTAIAGLKAIPNLDGLIVTIPHKAAMMSHADRVLPSGQRVGAVNALRRDPDGSWTADMFDGIGFLRGLEAKGLSVSGKRVLLFGGGGAGAAIAVALADAGASAIDLVDPDLDKVMALRRSLETACPTCRWSAGREAAASADVVVNASPIGMRPGDGLPAPLGELAPHVIVGDVIIAEEPTPLLRHARRYGCAVVDGRDMHTGQSDSLMDFFSGALPGA